MKRQDLNKSRQICSDTELLASDGHGQVGANRSPQLEADRVGCSAIKAANTQSVLEPPKKQFDLPTVTIKLGDNVSADVPLIGPEGEAAGVLKIVEADAAQQAGPVLWGIGAIEPYGLVAAQVGGAVKPAGTRRRSNARRNGPE